MKTTIDYAVSILKQHPNGIYFDDLFAEISRYYNYPDQEIIQKMGDLLSDLSNENNRFKIVGDKYFLPNQIQNEKDEYYDYNDISNVDDFKTIYVKALEEEIKNSYHTKRKYLIENGKLLDEDGKYKAFYSYAFDLTENLEILPNTDITLYVNKEIFFGKIISCDNYIIIFETKINLGKSIKELEFSTNSTQLLLSLKEKIEKLKLSKNSIAYELIHNGNKQQNRDEIIKGQDAAIKHALENRITFIWGPPGTGKTTTLTKIAKEFMKKKQRVLMVSYSNVAVDGAVMKLVDMSRNDSIDGEIIRYGYPKNENLKYDNKHYCYEYVLSEDEALHNEYKDLQKIRKKVDKKSIDKKDIDKRILEIRQHFKEKEKKLVQSSQCLFVATTVIKAIVDDAINSQKFDLVLFDEASMAFVPQVIYTASLAQTSFVCLGDYKQLPAITYDAGSILGKDIFWYVGIPQAISNKEGTNG